MRDGDVPPIPSGPLPGADLAHEVVQQLCARGQSVATAESLTGGLVAASLTAHAGASAAVRGGVVCYATDVKESVLGVDAELLAQRGAVDLDVARQLADGARDVLRADWGLATTGVAGPEPTDGQPIGRVYVAVAGPGGAGQARELTLRGDRAGIRADTVREVLALLGEILQQADSTPL